MSLERQRWKLDRQYQRLARQPLTFAAHVLELASGCTPSRQKPGPTSRSQPRVRFAYPDYNRMVPRRTPLL